MCVIAKIDSASTRRLIELQQVLKDFGLLPRNIYGHITLATYIGEDEDGFISYCKDVLSCHKKFSVLYDRIEVFAATSIIVAVPQVGEVISSIRKEILEHWEKELNKWSQKDTWQAHTTLAYNPDVDLYSIAEAMRERFEPFLAQVDEIEFSLVCESGYKKVGSIEL